MYLGAFMIKRVAVAGCRKYENYEEAKEYIDFCIDETESREFEQQRKYSMINEVLLFVIAFVQIAPMLYSALIGEYNDLQLWPIIVMFVLVIVAISFIVRKS